MPAMTDVQVENLHNAINAARYAGKCRYVLGGKPCCVIAQLAMSEGVPLDELEIWDHLTPGDGSERIFQINPPELSDYPMTLLARVQDVWDQDEEDQRQRMHDLVDGEALWLA